MADAFGSSSATANEEAVEHGTGVGPVIGVVGDGEVDVDVLHTPKKNSMSMEAPRVPAVKEVDADDEIKAVSKPLAARCQAVRQPGVLRQRERRAAASKGMGVDAAF